MFLPGSFSRSSVGVFPVSSGGKRSKKDAWTLCLSSGPPRFGYLGFATKYFSTGTVNAGPTGTKTVNYVPDSHVQLVVEYYVSV